MKILLLMPIDEQHTVAATEIYKDLPNEIREKTFSMPMYMQYLVSTHIAKYWEYALVDTMYASNKLLSALDKKDDYLLIGNAPAAVEFDAIFNFQDIEFDEKYEDKFLKKVAELVKADETLYNLVSNLHTADESKMCLHNCLATADFLAAYMGTDPRLDKIKEKYEETLKFKEKSGHGSIFKNNRT